MPKNSNSARSRDARELARSQGIKYTAALRLVSQAAAADPPIPPGALAAAAIDPAAGYAPDDFSPAAASARDDAAALARWEERRRARAVRLWEARIEVRCAATCEQEAWWRLCLYMREPRYRAPGLASESWAAELPGGQEHGTVEPVPAGGVSAAERDRLDLDYPRRPMAWPATWDPSGPEKTHDIAEYVTALRLAARRISGPVVDDVALRSGRTPLADALQLTVWRAVYVTRFLAGPALASARSRGAELAATIVDWTGRPLGRLLDVAPEDGFPDAVTGAWLHPACDGTVYDPDPLWDDYDAGASPPLQAQLFTREADWLERHWAESIAEADAWEARLHTHPDGSRTLSTPAELAAVAAAAAARHAGQAPAQLRKAAEHADYMADRVYGKVVENDQDFKRIEQARHQAATLRRLADAADIT